MSKEGLLKYENSSEPANNGEKGKAETSEKYLTFVSDGLSFAIASSFVIEIINEHSITPLPKVPSFIKGIINLRGQIISIMDVRLRMGRPEAEINRDTCIIVIDTSQSRIGLLVDKVSQMLEISESNISPPPSNSQQEFVSGITSLRGETYLMLDCESLLCLS